MKLKDRILAFEKLGEYLNFYISTNKNAELTNKSVYNLIDNAIEKSEILNPWFTKDNIIFSLKNIAKQLSKNRLQKWLGKYNISEKNSSSKKIGVVLAGNIPLVGFHDFLCVLITGNIFIGKLSSKDNILLKTLADILISINPKIADKIIFENNILKEFDAVIATGSDNSSVYFEQYFKNVPHIIRKNRTSVAILSGDENTEDLLKLGQDIFTYFGLGCRNVSKIYFPENYNLIKFIHVLEHFSQLTNHNKYANNYTYNQTLYLMKGIKYFDNGFVLLVEEKNISSPISVIYYEYYKNIHKLCEILESKSSQIQCVASNINGVGNSIKLGNTQKTELEDYADNIDTIKFLNSLH